MRFEIKRTSIFCIAIILSLLVSACGNKRPRLARMNVAPATAAPVARTLSPLPVRPLSPELQAVRARTLRMASELRELPWTGEVGMAELSGWEYGTRTSEMAQLLGGDDLRALGQLAAAGGVLPEGTDLATLAANFTAVSAGAIYSPLDKQVLLLKKFKGDSLLTHEFVHALQDQHFDLLQLLSARPYNFDRTEAIFAVVEGDAMNVQRRAEEGDLYGRRSLEEIARQEGERFGQYRKEIGALFPPLLTETFIFRYREGARFVEAVRRRGGERSVDELFRRPPASSEQILHPEKYVQAEAPRDIQVDEGSFTANGWRVVTSTPLGEIGIRGLLMAGVPDADAARAAAGWGGDRAYLLERASSSPLFVWKSVWDKRSDAQEFFNIYNALRRRSSQPVGDALSSADEAQTAWRDAGHVTLVRRVDDAVIVIRGSEADVGAALELAQR